MEPACRSDVLLSGLAYRRVAPLARGPAVVRALGDGRDRRRRPRRQERGRRPGPAGPRLVDRLAARRPPARDRRGLMRQEPDGSMVRHADLSDLGDHGWNEIVVDGRGNIYVNSSASTSWPGRRRTPPGIIALVTPDGSVRQVADGIEFPNGMAVTPDNSTLIISESFAGAAHRVRHRRRRQPVEPAGVGRRRRPRWHLHRRRRRDLDRCGLRSPTASSAGSAKVARCSSGSSSTAPASPACSAATTDRRCSCWPRTGAWTRASSDNIARLTTGPRTGRLLTAPAPAGGVGWP